MSEASERFAASAHALVGTRFRLHGRDPRSGLDCVGLVLLALQNAGLPYAEIGPYLLRQTAIEALLTKAEANNFVPCLGKTQRGDLLLVEPGPAQLHLVVAIAPNRFVHAHAALRKIVEQPGPLPWRLCARWRLAGSEKENSWQR
jgi:cell wall-associated NlpC family hydrolase